MTKELSIEAKNLAFRIAAIVKDKKGQKVVILDMRPVGGFCDYFVLISANSLRQVNAIARALEDNLHKDKIKPLSKVSAVDESGWVVLDFSTVVAHIFYKPLREFYSLERLWADAKKVKAPRKINLKKSL